MRMRVFFGAIIISIAMSATAIGQISFSEDQFRVFSGKGIPASFEEIINSTEAADVLFFGEYHDDAVGHAIQAEAFRRIVERYSGKRKITLSLEMFERDVQVVLDEYLASHITENHFLLSSRPWGNYKTDYRPLIELAKEKGLPVVAANAPRRYVNMVSRGGRAKVEALSPEAKRWLAPLPYGEPSAEYSKRFRALMGSSAEASMGLDNILSSQSLWDATMAYWISQALERHKHGLIVHLNGGFHTAYRLGTVEHLAKYSPKAKAVVITMRYEENFKEFDKDKHADLGDFVILTDGAVPRSAR